MATVRKYRRRYRLEFDRCDFYILQETRVNENGKGRSQFRSFDQHGQTLDYQRYSRFGYAYHAAILEIPKITLKLAQKRKAEKGKT